MPERPKRRKNNKNKRKNKNNRPDANKNNSDETKLDNSESCNTQNVNEEDCAASEVTETKEIKVEILQPSTDNQNTASSTSSDIVNLNGDLNNNSNQIVDDVLPTPDEKCQDTVYEIVDTKAYVVEAPEPSHQSKAKLKSKVKSKSLDDDDTTKIIEITDDDTDVEPGADNALALIDTQNVVVTHVESDVEWESAADLNEINVTKPQELAIGTLSVTTIPLNVAQCDQTKSLTPDEEKSLRSYLNTLNLATHPDGLNAIEMKTEIEEIINQEIKHRLRKKASADDFFLHRLGPPRMLDVIDEEGSGSGSSMTSRRQSYLSDKRSDVEDLDDDVFEDNKNKLTKQKKMMSVAVHKKTFGQLVPQECVLVGAKLKEPEVSEARGDWTMKTVEKMTGAEVVYLTDTSSSTSSLHEIEDEDDGVETDVSVRMITPTIEVTDTENFLKKTFISNVEDNKKDILNERQQTKQDKINETTEKINVPEKNHEELISKNINSEHIIKVELEDGKSNNITNSVPVPAGTERIVEIIQDAETKNKSQNLIQNNDAHIVKITHDQDLKDKQLPPSGKTKETKKERVINIEYENSSTENKRDFEKVSSQNSHEIVVLSTDNIKTNLYVKDIDEPINKEDNNQSKSLTKQSKYDLESKVIKCEFNDAINNLIKEVASESEETNENLKDTFSRQDSSSSVDSSQCTAKYNPNYSSLNDISNMTHDETSVNNKINSEQLSSTTSHVKDVFECVAGTTAQSKTKTDDDPKEPLKLRDICVRNIATLPYGQKILEELASVSERLQHIALYGTSTKPVDSKQENVESMPHYQLPDVSSIETISIPTKPKDPIPPPIKPRRSSLRKSSQEDEHWTGIPTKSEPVYVCLSPSQKMLMEKTNTVISKDDASHLVDMHRKYVDRRGYNEQYKNEKEREENEIDTTPIIPFKSQTGSRLLALIRDPTLTTTINSLNQRLNSSSDEIQKKRTTATFAKSNHDRFPSRDFSFKPIPPPRPKKYSSSFYESDESSDFTDSSMRSMKSERKFFHYSTGNLNKEIESDISSIQNMHRYFIDTRDEISDYKCPRRPSLPKDLCEQQMEYIRKKEKEVEAEIQRLEALKNNIPQMQKQGPKAPLVSEKEVISERIRDSNNYSISRKKDVVMSTHGSETRKAKLSAFSSSQEELLREKMYSEYVSQMAEREERKQHKVIKITNAPASTNHITISKSMPTLDILDGKVNNRIEKEFISKARERWDKLGIKDPETEDERETSNVYKEPKVIEHKIKVIEGGEEKDVKKLPSHLQEFVRFTAKDSEQGRSSSAIWRPGAPPPTPGSAARSPGAPPPPPPPPVWTPGSAGASPQTPRKSFRPVHFEETPPSRRKFPNSEQNGCTSGSESEGRLRTSHSAPVTGLSTLGSANLSSRLPKAQNPTVTLLQKAREGQLPRGSNYFQQERDAARLPRDRPSPPRGDPVHALRKEYASEGEAERSDYERGGIRKMADAHRKVEGIGPITKDGMPVALRSEVKDPSRWYKKMYDTIHKNKYDDDYVTIRYKSRRGQPPERVLSNKSQYAYFDPRSGYLSEPEGGLSRLGTSTWSDAYDSDVTTGPRRRTASVQEDRRFCEVNSQYIPNTNKYSTLASARASQEVYKNQPGRIENYVPGKSSVVDKEAKQQNISSTTSLPQSSPKDKKDLTTTILSKSNMARALKESGYESDSTLVFRRREDTEAPLSPAERRAAYRDLQAGGEPPLRGFRSPAPPRQESPRRYVESDVNIHYRCPVRHDPLPLVPERELARQQAEHMKRLYREQKRNKYLQELQDMQNRRHQDNFTPSQKNILPLNRYDEAEKVIAKALYTFNGQTPRELSFRKGEMIHVRRQIDNNWYEGELHGRIGLFPYNYVEIQKGDVVQAPKKPVVVEGRARAKFDFTAQTNLELPLKKGEVVVLTRRIDQNWWEGRNGTKTGIFPDSYVTILQEPSPSKPDPQPILNSDKPVASPAAHCLLNGSAKRSMGSHSYTPQQNSPALSNAPPATQPLPGYVAAKPAQATLTPSERGYGPPTGAGVDLNNTEPLYVDTNAEAIPYRAMYKYRPQNPDELELNEGDTVYVLEKCDDGWYVGSSQRTGRFGTFPGNYVERI